MGKGLYSRGVPECDPCPSCGTKRADSSSQRRYASCASLNEWHVHKITTSAGTAMSDSFCLKTFAHRQMGCARIALLSAGILLLAACGGGGGGGPPPPPPVVAFANATATVDSGTTTAQTATGGAPPYTYSVAAGGGTIDASGHFTSPTGPATVTLEVTDSKGATAEAAITVNAPLVANQPAVTVGGGTSLLVGAAGGQGPFTYQVSSG